MSLLTDVHSFLSSSGQGTSLYIGSLPDAPDVAVALFQYAGRSPQSVHDRAGISRERPGLQVLVRSSPNAYADAEVRAYAIFDLLQVANRTLGSGFYQEVTPMASPFLMERDDNRRAIIACNYITSRDWT